MIEERDPLRKHLHHNGSLGFPDPALLVVSVSSQSLEFKGIAREGIQNANPELSKGGSYWN